MQDLAQFFWDEDEVMKREYQILDTAFDRMVDRAKRDKIYNRTSAMASGVERVRDMKNTRGLFP